jgi:putative FmdB family regulatory protein
MPLYEYLCKKCGHRFEKIQKFSDKPIKKCPECGGSVEQVINAPAVQFKGSGWYVTDYAKSGASAASDGGKDKEKDSKTETSKTESTGKEGSAKESGTKEPAKASPSKKADKQK